jgi:hypothetical protein
LDFPQYIIYVAGFHKGVQADIFRGRHATFTRMHFPDSKTLTGIVIVRHDLPLFTNDRERRGEGVQLRGPREK